MSSEGFYSRTLQKMLNLKLYIFCDITNYALPLHVPFLADTARAKTIITSSECIHGYYSEKMSLYYNQGTGKSR